VDPQTQTLLEPLTSLLPRNSEVFWLGAIASLFAGLGTSIGALGIFLLRKPSTRTLNALISGAAGVMLTASFLSPRRGIDPCGIHSQKNRTLSCIELEPEISPRMQTMLDYGNHIACSCAARS
jgi:hypothetical protein